MFDMSLEWWEFVLRGVVVYLTLLLIVRVSGKRTVGQFTPFDLLVVMLLSEAVSNSLNGGDESLVGGLILAVTLVALNLTIAYAVSHNRRVEKMIEGSEVLLGRDGRIFEDVVKAHRIGQNEINGALHEADVDIKEMAFMILEADGVISVLKKK